MKKYRFLSLLLAVLMALSLTAPAAALEDPRPHAKAANVAVSYKHLTLPTICSV